MQRNQSNKSNLREINIPENILDDPIIQTFRDFDINNGENFIIIIN